ncbi:CaiB/BaiF CoA transferase family protein [Paraburkholderia unamae]|uniref:Crotonobetainyl-CoA:carnitine CoA-transferase CaiB-like acyl-CoA transferase n=1 Tax=Paraburkholderia unamae TaxID=219649 RepID=A0ABX5K9P7_9BURK|nr:CoA transferase [Paraburkholderia unamae]PVX71583.1 crotonobetainyl-CoA:carnitine CoA-transferase CaiB-like acyl-CoA transferase [Paraburkholderia unamae]CAG9274682.1 L-carnitine dehydratase/bile acid-inducible protein F [Paraburkholderia unamae]
MSSKPLAGVRVLEVGAYISAPYAGMLLSALGADVVKIEPLDGEAFRRGIGNASHYFVQYNAGKRSVAVDLKSPEGVRLIKTLLPQFDVLTENMRPGKMEKLGLGVEVCREINPRLVYASVSGFGSGGPLSDRPAYDTIGQSYGGFYHMMNDEGHARLTGTCLADLITGVSATMGILAALLGRERSREGTGALVETSLLEAISLLTIDAITQRSETSQDPTRESRHPQAQNFCLNTASGGAVTLHLSGSEKFWAALTRAIERPDLFDDPRFRRYSDRVVPENYRALVAILEEAFATRSRDEWERRLAEADVPYAPVLSLSELAAHPQVRWLELMGASPDGQTLVRPPWRFDGQRPQRGEPTAHVGEHTRQVLREILSESEVEALIANGTVASAG